jgi:hypothetical protein
MRLPFGGSRVTSTQEDQTRERKMNETTCTETTCAVHNRVDGSVFDDGMVYFIINYVGEYAVVTRENPILSDPLTAISAALAGHKVDLLVTAVQYVKDGTVGDNGDFDLRWLLFHDSDELAQETHDRIVERVKTGDIDLTTTVPEGAFYEGESSK